MKLLVNNQIFEAMRKAVSRSMLDIYCIQPCVLRSALHHDQRTTDYDNNRILGCWHCILSNSAPLYSCTTHKRKRESACMRRREQKRVRPARRHTGRNAWLQRDTRAHIHIIWFSQRNTLYTLSLSPSNECVYVRTRTMMDVQPTFENNKCALFYGSQCRLRKWLMQAWLQTATVHRLESRVKCTQGMCQFNRAHATRKIASI